MTPRSISAKGGPKGEIEAAQGALRVQILLNGVQRHALPVKNLRGLECVHGIAEHAIQLEDNDSLHLFPVDHAQQPLHAGTV